MRSSGFYRCSGSNHNKKLTHKKQNECPNPHFTIYLSLFPGPWYFFEDIPIEIIDIAVFDEAPDRQETDTQLEPILKLGRMYSRF